MKGKTRKRRNSTAVALMRIEKTPVAYVWFTCGRKFAHSMVAIAKNQAKRQFGRPEGAVPGSGGAPSPAGQPSRGGPADDPLTLSFCVPPPLPCVNTVVVGAMQVNLLRS
ncbi:hypothetical protein [Actinomadura miaoliensis]|uniref:Uncharacterized protein n=1 Tax=Actinomadura miaoliensis TaxID=430685 RepID=A0ABP7X5E2_9ACTN